MVEGPAEGREVALGGILKNRVDGIIEVEVSHLSVVRECVQIHAKILH